MATREQLIEDFADHKYATGEKFARLINSMKLVQEPVEDPAASGTSLSFIDSVSQNADGKITATKKTLDLANAHELNPFKGWYKTGDTLPTDGFDGAYLYFKDTSELTGLTTIYRWNGTTYADTGTVVDTSNVQTFATGQAVSGTGIKDLDGNNDLNAAGILSAEAGRELGEELGNLNRPNMNIEMSESGYIKYETGNKSASESYHTSDYVDISNYTNLRYDNLNPIGTVGVNIAFYDSSKTYLQSISVRGNSSSRTGEIDLTATDYASAKYVRVCESIGETTGTVVLVDVNSIIPQLKKEVEMISDDVGELKGEVGNVYVEELSANFDSNGYIRWGDGNSTGLAETYKRTDFIDVSNYTNINYHVGGTISSIAAVVAFYDANKGYLQDISVRGNNAIRTGEIDLTTEDYASVAYVRFCAAASLVNVYARIYNRNALNYQVSELDGRVNQLDQTGGGIKVLIFGDSITDNMGLSVNDTTNCSESCYFRTTDYVNGDGQTVVYKKWPQLLAEFFETNEVRNYARSGASYKDQPSYTSGENRRRSLSYQITVAENDLSNPNGVFPTEGAYVPDVVVFALGTNDGNPNDTFDSAIAKIVYNTEDTVDMSVDIAATLAALDRSKFNEAVMYAFLKVKSMFPTALFMCLLPIQRWANSAVMGNLHESLKAMANYFSIPVVDGAYEMGIIQALEVNSGLGALLKDGLHPNEKGQNIMARMMISQIKSRFVSMGGMNV